MIEKIACFFVSNGSNPPTRSVLSQPPTGNVPPLYFAVGASESILGDSVRVAQHAAQGGVDVILEAGGGHDPKNPWAPKST